jgi:FkbM family methyltransferase
MTRPSLLRERRVVLYGAGSVARDVLRALRSEGISVERIFDHYAAGRNIDGIPVEDATGNAYCEAAAEGMAIVVAVFNPHADVNALMQSAKEVGWPRVYSFVDAYECLHQHLGSRFWLAPRSLWRDHADDIAACRSLWTDPRSIEIFDAIVAFRTTGDYGRLPTPSPSDQYFPADLPRWKEPLRLVDGGAFDGDTIRAAIAKGYQLSAVSAFEPDPQNFVRLRTFTDTLRNITIDLSQHGLWDSNEVVSFAANATAGSAIDSSGHLRITCVALDHASLKFSPTLIKLDIEGAERRALKGAAGIIHAHRPGIAVCLYHRPADLWEIPLQMQAEFPAYSFHLRLHAFSGFDLVMYLQPL